MKKNIDLLLLARPDHSYTIYKSLLKSNLDFIYCSFKLMPQWMNIFVKNPRVRYYSRNYSNCKRLTLFHLARLKLHKDLWERHEKKLFEKHLTCLLDKVEPKLIHYWPYLTLDSIREYKRNHANVKTFADVYFPCEDWVIDNIFPVLRKNGLNEDVLVRWNAERMHKTMEFEDNFIVPSPFIADTYKQYYPDKNYIIIPYGLTKWSEYKRKPNKTSSDQIRTFVYAGEVTIQKGCDYLLRYFKKHPELELHIFGRLLDKQKHILEEYQDCRNIVFHGWVPKSLLQEYVSKYDVGVHLSRYDAYSLSVGEMMGAGLPVIVSDKTGIFFTVNQIGAGLVTPLDDDRIEGSFGKMRRPEVYNQFLENLDKYLLSSPRFYKDEIIDFYKKQLDNE